MAQHGYLGQGYGSHREIDPDRDEGRGIMFREERGRGDRDEHRRSYNTHPDDLYRSWRDRHMAELDRDYEEYRREREQQFHADFDLWRRQRGGNAGPLRTGMAQTGLSTDPTGMTQAEDETAPFESGPPDPTDTATIGTSGGGRRRP